ncbi:MAG: alpha/beta hydrolase [Balneolaceae bacterium]
MAPTNHIFDYHGTPVSYQVIGEGKPLIQLHGWGSSSRVMVPVAKQLQAVCRSLLVDLPGFGNSPEPPQAWAVSDYADMIGAFIQSTGEKEVDLLVHSFGGRIALKLLTRKDLSYKIGRVLITGGAGMKPKRPLSFYFRKYLARALKAPLLILPAGLRKIADRHLRKTALWKKLGSPDYRSLTGIMRETFVKSVTEHLDDLLPEIEHEILLLWGEDDEATPLYQARRMEAGLKNGALVIIDGAGHYAFLDKPKQFAAIAKAFLKNP